MVMTRSRGRLRARRRRNDGEGADLHPLVRLWILRLLIELGGDRNFIVAGGFRDDVLAADIGLQDWVEAGDEMFDAKAVRRDLRQLHRKAELDHCQVRPPRDLERNMGLLAGLANLSETETKILTFAILLHQEPALDTAADLLGGLSTAKVSRALSVLLDLPEPEVRAALKQDATLVRTGLLSVEHGTCMSLQGKLDLISPDFADRILSVETDPVSFIRDTVAPASAPDLAPEDYGHVASHLKLLLSWLGNALRTRRQGVNLLFHGLPGTGKSQLARVLAAELGCDLFEIAAADGDGDPTEGRRRLRAFRAAQCFFAGRKAMLVFDEVEDVFGECVGLFGMLSRSSPHKAWINRTLEGNPVPAIWISNSASCLDDAFLRRFDMVVELPIPPRRQRRRILEAACGDLLEAGQIDRFAGCEALAPAIAARAATVIRTVRGDIGDGEVAAAFELLVNGTLEAQGRPPLGRAPFNPGSAVYDLRFLNADIDLASVTAKLREERAGRICLYGPPGTGKTAWGTWLAGQMDMPLHVKRGSDLLSKWVGGSEENIAAAFREAERDGAILLIDEVDGFLRDRAGARAGWEVTQVNEMLTRMEEFPGLFIASTNLMEGLDQAALRRFQLKVRLNFLAADQSWLLFRRYCTLLDHGRPGPLLRDRIGRLENLTPGDFATVLGRARFDPLPSAAALAAALEAECAMKAGSGARVGFV